MEHVVQVLGPREVPLGGPRAMTVRRTLPARERSFVGAWCFADHYGPDDVAATGGMDVAPHPHCGLATVSWLFSGEVEHRDSLGTTALVRPGEVNLMTAGRGISHSEVSTSATTVLHGAQLWVALPEAAAGVEPRFEHHVPEVLRPAEGVTAQVFVGSLWGAASPVRTESPLLGVEVVLDGGAEVGLPVPDDWEVGVLVDDGGVTFCGQALERAELGVVDAADPAAASSPGPRVVRAGSDGARVLVLAGKPFGEEIVMWWNFVGRSHDEVVAAREAWESGADGEEAGPFGRVDGYSGETPRIPAPALPGVRLRSRGNRGRPGHPEAEAPAMS
ncbi:pirin family protein [Phycicoccus sp. BSK3Z-2]|uniref:Pirin family protein n=1 Tax=Phycicoccus avicenniae TaxID=2828860 RepID=A0A941D821_9MICO|nr:pirin family protein [Phycicoccus avicenniae]MBR7742545.1 pirin family protein [Phycicoccus avicenniae]